MISDKTLFEAKAYASSIVNIELELPEDKLLPKYLTPALSNLYARTLLQYIEDNEDIS